MSLSMTLRRLLAGLGLLVALVLAPEEARAQQCNVEGAFGMNFGEVSRAGGQATSQLEIICQSDAIALYFTVCVFIGPGIEGTIDPRRMRKYYPPDLLEYDLFSDPNHQHLLGSPGTLSGASLYQVHVYSPPYIRVSEHANVYGLVYPRQTVIPGEYEETGVNGLLIYTWSADDFPDFSNCTGGQSRTFESSEVTAMFADSCIVSASDLDFGEVTTLGQSVTGESIIRVDCPAGKEWSLGLDNGQNPASGTRRMMGSGGHNVHYGLYIDPARTRDWGDTDAEDRYAGATDGSANPVEVTVYGEVPAQDDVPPGRYTDTVIATLYY